MSNPNDLLDSVDPTLQKLYHQLPKEQPSVELDEKILAAAKLTMPNTSQNPILKKTLRWQAPFALAASVVMVSSVALYMHEENSAVFDASVPTIQNSVAEVAKPAIEETATVSDSSTPKKLIDNKLSSKKSKDSSSTKSEESPSARIDDVEDNLTAPTEKKADIAIHAEQIAEITSANISAKFAQSTSAAKEQEVIQTKIVTDQFATAARAPAAYAPTPVTTPSPASHMQPQPEVSQLATLQADHLQDSNRVSGQLSATLTELDKPFALEKSNAAPALSAKPMAVVPMNLVTTAGSAVPMRQTEREEVTTKNEAKTDVTQNISAPVLSIEGVAMGMTREQLVTQGMMCYVDVCHLDLSQPQQATYWGLPTLNGRLTAYLSHHVVTKLLLQQKNGQLNQVKIALSNVGIASQQSCIKEKGALLIGRQLGANTFNVRSMGTGLSLAICQYAK